MGPGQTIPPIINSEEYCGGFRWKLTYVLEFCWKIFSNFLNSIIYDALHKNDHFKLANYPVDDYKEEDNVIGLIWKKQEGNLVKEPIFFVFEHVSLKFSYFW